MNGLLQRVERAIVERRLLDDGDAALIAVSGGIDSMVLLHVLHALGPQHRWNLVVAHFNHRLRGRAADLDQQFVGRMAGKLGLRFECAGADVKALARERKLSVEMAARRLRHEFLAHTARSIGVGKVLLAHHADDQVELFFLRLFRGAGTLGLAGMEWSSPSPADGNIALLRPLLGETKGALAEFAREKKINFREDATNRAVAIARNRIRHELLPLLRRKYQTQIDGVVLRSMELARGDSEFVKAEAMAWLEKKRAGRFDALPIALQRCVMQLELLRAGIVPPFEQVERLRVRANEWVVLRAGTICRRKATGEIEVRAAPPATFGGAGKHLDLEARTKRASFDGVQFTWRVIQGAKLPPKPGANVEFFDADAVGPEIVLRHWRAGDRYRPIGMKSPVKLQDWFVNQKIARAQRHQLVLATTAAGEIFWVEGLRIGERFKVTSDTGRILKWKWKR